ncbi:MAG: YihY/virulence factor BrkB family protein [Bacteroidales bacterium]|nr:YihY/virulence factor BrkB family protein [Bacteroidales bacterium]
MKFFERIKKGIAVRIRWVRIMTSRVVRFITIDMWRMNADDLEHRKARLLKDAKVAVLTFNTFSNQKIGFQATALSYQSVMSIVPFLAIAFYLTGGLGLSDKLSAFLYANISNERLINSLMDAADNILKTAQSGLFGLISMLAFLWIVIWLMISVRRVFNNVWQVERELKFFRMFGISLGILILSPFVILLFFSGSIVYTHVLDLAVPSRVAFSEHIKSFLAWVIYAGAAVMILSAMYKYIPGTKVHYRQALKAALIAGPVFMVLQYLYLETQVMVTRVSTVYGVLAALPLFLTYLNLGWTIVLYGAELSYAYQNVDKYTIEQIERMNAEAVEEKKRKRREVL